MFDVSMVFLTRLEALALSILAALAFSDSIFAPCGSARADQASPEAKPENPIAFCLGHAAHHRRVHLNLKARLCRDCGHVEFWTPDPSRIVREREAAMIPEKDF